MAASAEIKLVGSAEKANTSGQITNGSAAATFAAVAGTKHYVQKAIISASGTIAAGVRATLTWTKDAVAQTVGISIPIGFTNTGIAVIDFGNNPLEGDDNTAITLTIPALGAAGIGEAAIIGFSRLV